MLAWYFSISQMYLLIPMNVDKTSCILPFEAETVLVEKCDLDGMEPNGESAKSSSHYQNIYCRVLELPSSQSHSLCDVSAHTII